MVLPQLCWALMGCGRLCSVIGCDFCQGLTQAHPGFSSFCLTGRRGCFTVGLLFYLFVPKVTFGVPDTVLQVYLGFGVSYPGFQVLLFAVRMMKEEAGGGR